MGITDRDVEGLWEYFDGDPLDVTTFSQYPWEQREYNDKHDMKLHYLK
jgi:hypothetical protein